MSEFSGHVDAILANCLENREAIAKSLNLCFDQEMTIEIGEATSWPPEDLPDELTEPGLIFNLHVGDGGLAIAVPASLPLPLWTAEPNDSQQARMNTLPMEWSTLTVPDSIEVDKYSYHRCDLLEEAVTACAPEAGAKIVPWNVKNADGEESRIWLILPVANVYTPKQPKGEKSPKTAPSREDLHNEQTPPDHRKVARDRQIKHLLKLPVPIIVKLAEKRIELGQLLSLGPGAIVTFDKSCEDLLELCVNNEVYCRGEAVKIGEKFGLKINEVGSLSERERALLQSRIIV